MAQIIRSFFLVYNLAIPFAVQFSCMLTWLWERGRGSQCVKVDKPERLHLQMSLVLKYNERSPTSLNKKIIFMHSILKNV